MPVGVHAPASMRSNDFPLRIEAGGQVYAPAMLASFDETTQVWAVVDGKPAIVATGPALTTKDTSIRGTRLSDGHKARWQALLADGTAWLVAHHPHCCSCHRNALCGFVPPEPVPTETIEVTA